MGLNIKGLWSMRLKDDMVRADDADFGVYVVSKVKLLPAWSP